MVLISRRNNKVVGSIFILFGIFCIYYLFNSKNLTLDQYSFFIARYFKVIFLSYGGLLLFVFGVLYFIGFLTPYYAANPYEKAKANVWQSIFSFPLFMLMFLAASSRLDISDIQSYIIVSILLSFVLIVWSVWSFFAGLNVLKSFHKNK
jgi:hypothetical protein